MVTAPPVVATDGAALADAAVTGVALADAAVAGAALADAAVTGVALGDAFVFAAGVLIPCLRCFAPGVALAAG